MILLVAGLSCFEFGLGERRTKSIVRVLDGPVRSFPFVLLLSDSWMAHFSLGRVRTQMDWDHVHTFVCHITAE